MALFVPQAEGERFETGGQGERLNGLKQGFGAVAFFQMIIRDAGAQMVNVVKSDVAGKPLQQARELIEGTAFQSGFGIIPFLAALPIDSIKLMLHVEEPESGGTGDHQGRELQQQIALQTKKPNKPRHH